MDDEFASDGWSASSSLAMAGAIGIAKIIISFFIKFTLNDFSLIIIDIFVHEYFNTRISPYSPNNNYGVLGKLLVRVSTVEHTVPYCIVRFVLSEHARREW